MIFEVDSKTKTLNAYKSFWNPHELELEEYLISTAEEEVPTLKSSVFGETLPLVSNQVSTKASKKADILALDHMGNSVIIELKRKNSPWKLRHRRCSISPISRSSRAMPSSNNSRRTNRA